MENISEFLKTGDREFEKRATVLEQIRSNTSDTKIAVGEVKKSVSDTREKLQDGSGVSRKTVMEIKESIERIRVFPAGVLDKIIKTSDSTLEHVKDTNGSAKTIKDSNKEFDKIVCDINTRIEKLPKSDNSRIIKMGTLFSLVGLLLLMALFYRGCVSDSSFQTVLDTYQASANVPVTSGVGTKSNIVLDDKGVLNNSTRVGRDETFRESLSRVIESSAKFNTSASVSERWFAFKELRDTERTKQLNTKIDTAAEETRKYIDSVLSKRCTYDNPCTVYRVPHNSCIYKFEVENAELRELRQKILQAHAEIANAENTNKELIHVVEFRGSANLKSAAGCPNTDDNIDLAIFRANGLRKEVSKMPEFHNLAIRDNTAITVSSEPTLLKCTIRGSQSECDYQNRNARIVRYIK